MSPFGCLLAPNFVAAHGKNESIPELVEHITTPTFINLFGMHIQPYKSSHKHFFAETHKTLFFASFISAILALPCCVSTPGNTILWWPTKQYFHIENASSLAVSTASLCHNNAAACAHISMNQTLWHQWLPPVSFSIKIFSLPQPESYFHKTEKLEAWQNDDIKE